MKKVMTIICLLLLSVFVFVNEKSTTRMVHAEALAFAEYVSEENAPKIDGIIDSSWNVGLSGITTKTSAQGTRGSVDILWNEQGLYFLVIVIDYTLNETDVCNLWVSEQYLGNNEAYINGTSYDEVNGAYSVCLNGNGENLFLDQQLNWFTAAGKMGESSYILEVYVPLRGDNILVYQGSIGFELSVDDYFFVGTSVVDRGAYVNWLGLGDYWSNPSKLGEVLLVDVIETNGSPSIIEKPEDSSNIGSSGETSSANSSNSSSTSETIDAGDKGCTSTLTGSSICVFMGLATIAFLKKKKA